MVHFFNGKVKKQQALRDLSQQTRELAQQLDDLERAQEALALKAKAEEARKAFNAAQDKAKTARQSWLNANTKLATMEQCADWFEAYFKCKKNDRTCHYLDAHGGINGTHIMRHGANVPGASVPAFEGKWAVKIIVPEGVSVAYDDLGNNMLLMPYGECKNGLPILHKDMKQELERRGYSFAADGTAAVRVTGFPNGPAPLALDPEVQEAIKALNKPARAAGLRR